ncbi:TetR/AcrR family transcriptional regulator [Actinokineospora guangxiensis]|uniref:TetR/AcrR family transcriptional regulator n=1 Tax=Actinokineospora guangxiensis TaxID=1490288 RepID=A0ABW0EH87_9PSEU
MASKQDWLTEGMAVLVQRGEHALTIEELCTGLGLTKGSFYHHFKGMSAYKAALLAQFEAEWTTRFIDLAENYTDLSAREKLVRLLDVVEATGSPEPEVTIRVWAQRDPQARTALDQVDAARTAYARTLLMEAGLTPDDADRRARTLSLLVIGADFAVPRPSPAELRALLQHVIDEEPACAG